MTFQYEWTDNPTESGKSVCDTDILNSCLMHLKYDYEQKVTYDAENERMVLGG